MTKKGYNIFVAYADPRAGEVGILYQSVRFVGRDCVSAEAGGRPPQRKAVQHEQSPSLQGCQNLRALQSPAPQQSGHSMASFTSLICRIHWYAGEAKISSSFRKKFSVTRLWTRAVAPTGRQQVWDFPRLR